MNGDATAFYSRLSHKGAACFHFYLLMEITQPCKHWSAALTAGARREMRAQGEEGRWGGCGAAEAQIKIGSLEAWGASFLAQAALPGMEFGNKTKLVLLGNITAPRQENTRMGKLSAAVCCGV
jgi:hypothetical protein